MKNVFFYSVIKLREQRVRSHKFYCQNHVLWTVPLHLCYLNKKFSFLGKLGGKCFLYHPKVVLMVVKHFFISR